VQAARYRIADLLIFRRQCMPGLDNKSLDDQGRPMRNWWVFLFY